MLEADVSELFVRSYPLEDISIRSDGDGRTVEAYAAVFNTDTEIHDHQGHYLERIDARAFERTLQHKGTRFGVFYNHGLTLHGTPSERASMPIGTPLEVRADSRGLWTITRYNANPLADEVLEAIRTGAITGQSFSGRFVGSNPRAPRGGFRRAKDGTLTVVTRSEIAMTEYGPTPFPAYEAAAIVGVRSGCPHCAGLPDLSDTTPVEVPEPGSERNATPEQDPPAGHSGRSIHWNSIRMKMRERGIK